MCVAHVDEAGGEAVTVVLVAAATTASPPEAFTLLERCEVDLKGSEDGSIQPRAVCARVLGADRRLTLTRTLLGVESIGS